MDLCLGVSHSLKRYDIVNKNVNIFSNVLSNTGIYIILLETVSLKWCRAVIYTLNLKLDARLHA